MSEKSEKSEKNECAIRAVGLVKRYGSFCAVDGVSFDVEHGTLFSLLGVNRAGKTTTVRMLCGLLRPDEGSALIYGRPAGEKPTSRLIGLSPQETSVSGNLTVRENLVTTAEIFGFRDALHRSDDVMERLGLCEYSNRLARHLSGGLCRRLSIGMALVTDPRVLFLDEPTLGLDVIARRELWDMISELKRHVTIILTTHYMEEAQKLSDKIAIIGGGRIRAMGNLEELRRLDGGSAEDDLEEIFIRIAEGKNEGENT